LLRLVAGGWSVLREKYCWLVADKPSERAAKCRKGRFSNELNKAEHLQLFMSGGNMAVELW
jgi:hypothetical protein